MNPPEVATPLELQRRRVEAAKQRYESELRALRQMQEAARPTGPILPLPLPAGMMACCPKAKRIQCTCGPAMGCEEHGIFCPPGASHD